MLKSISPLGGFSAEINQVTIKEVTGRSIVSLAVPKNGEAKLKAAVKKELKLELPLAGRFTTSKSANGVLAWTSPDQYFYIADEESPEPEKDLKAKFGDKTYATNQSDAFVQIAVSGPRKLEALERICPIDIRSDQFPIGSVARTTMEHLGAMIMRTSKDEYTLISASSSAKSFLHAIETSANNI